MEKFFASAVAIVLILIGVAAGALAFFWGGVVERSVFAAAQVTCMLCLVTGGAMAGFTQSEK